MTPPKKPHVSVGPVIKNAGVTTSGTTELSKSQHPKSLQVSQTEKLTLRFRTEDATALHIDPLGDFPPANDHTGSAEIPTEDNVYTLTASDGSGASEPWQITVATHAPDAVISSHALVSPGPTDVPGASASGTLRAIPQPWNERLTRVWFPDSAKGKKVPLVIYLHGLVFEPDLQKHPNAEIPPDGQLMATPAELKRLDWTMNVANVASIGIAANKTVPLVIAAPSERKPERSSHFVFSNLILADLVELVIEAVGTDLTIDLDQVSVVAWSASGGNEHFALMKIGDEGGKFKDKDGTEHTLKVIGIADCRSHDGGLSKGLQASLQKAGNSTTVIYGIQKDNGGWKGSGYVPPSNLTPFADGFGATTAQTRPYPSDQEEADADMFDVYLVDDLQNPTRTVTRIRNGDDPKKGIPAQQPGLHHHDYELNQAEALSHPEATEDDPDKAQNRPYAHKMMPMLWTWFALPRFYKPQ